MRELQQSDYELHYESWRRVMRSTGPSNHAMAVSALNQLYTTEKRSKPAVIFCQSPFQMALLPKLLTQTLSSERWVQIRKKFSQGNLSGQRQKEEWDQCWCDLWMEQLMPAVENMLIKEVPNFGAYVRQVGPLTEALKRELRSQLLWPQKALMALEGSSTEAETEQWWQQPEIANDGPERLNRLMGELAKLYGYSPAVNSTISPQLIENFWRLNLSGQRSGASMRTMVGALGRHPARQLAQCLWLPFALHWVPGFLAVDEIKSAERDADAQPTDSEASILMRPWWTLANSAGAVLFADDIVFICDRPIEMHSDDDGLLHNPAGAAILYKDGFQGFAWHGTAVSSDLILHPDRVTVAAIDSQSNVEMRRVLVEIYGLSRYLVDSGADIIHEDYCGALYRKEIGPGEPLVMVRVKNATAEPDGTCKEYFLRVPPNMVRAKQAVAWTFQVPEGEYSPDIET